MRRVNDEQSTRKALCMVDSCPRLLFGQRMDIADHTAVSLSSEGIRSDVLLKFCVFITGRRFIARRV